MEIHKCLLRSHSYTPKSVLVYLFVLVSRSLAATSVVLDRRKVLQVTWMTLVNEGSVIFGATDVLIQLSRTEFLR